MRHDTLNITAHGEYIETPTNGIYTSRTATNFLRKIYLDFR